MNKMNFTNVNTIESKAVLCVSVIMFACAVSFVNNFSSMCYLLFCEDI